MGSRYGDILAYLEVDDSIEQTPGSGDFRVLRFGLRNRSHLPCVLTVWNPDGTDSREHRIQPLAQGWRTLPPWVEWMSDIPSLSAYHPWWEIEMFKIRIRSGVTITDELVAA